MSGPSFFGRFWGARHFGRPYWGPRSVDLALPGEPGVSASLVHWPAKKRRREDHDEWVLLALALIEADEED